MEQGDLPWISQKRKHKHHNSQDVWGWNLQADDVFELFLCLLGDLQCLAQIVHTNSFIITLGSQSSCAQCLGCTQTIKDSQKLRRILTSQGSSVAALWRSIGSVKPRHDYRYSSIYELYMICYSHACLCVCMQLLPQDCSKCTKVEPFTICLSLF